MKRWRKEKMGEGKKKRREGNTIEKKERRMQ